MADYDKHWVSDEDLLERFVLGRLSAREREPLEVHLRQCEQCRTAVGNEARIAAGVRLFEKEELKSRLRSGIERQRRRNRRFAFSPSGIFEYIKQFRPDRLVPWYALAGATATVIIAIGIGFYNNWFITQPAQESQIAANGKQSESTPENRSAEKYQTEEKQITRDSRSMTEGNHASEQLAKVDAASTSLKKDVPAPSSVQSLEQKNESPPIIADRTGVSEEDKQLKETASEAVAANGVWIEGRETTFETKDQSVKSKVLRAEQQLESESAPKSDEIRSSTMKIQQADLKILQRPFSTLPTLQQHSVRASQGKVVITLLKQSADSMEIVLFSDPPIPENEITSGRAILIGSDSLVLFFSTRQISYQLPQGWNSARVKK